MRLQPGLGYTFFSSSEGMTLDTSKQFDSADQSYFEQFRCIVYQDGTDFYLKTAKGVVNYTWSQFPFRPEPDGSGGEYAFQSYEKQARITDWAVYENSARTAGTDTDTDWMADNGKIKLPAGASGKSVVVTISKIDWWDKDGWLAAYRTIDAEKPFVSVFDAADANINSILTQQGCSLHSGNTLYESGGSFTNDPPVPLIIGYTVKKIAQLDWNDTTNSWDVTQYLVGPIDLPIQRHSGSTFLNSGTAPSPSTYDTALANEFDTCLNYAWFEGMWAYPGYTMNSSDWWYDIVNA